VKTGDRVSPGDRVAVIESMKMRRSVHASRAGVVQEILVKEGDVIEPGSVLMVLA